MRTENSNICGLGIDIIDEDWSDVYSLPNGMPSEPPKDVVVATFCTKIDDYCIGIEQCQKNKSE